MDEVDQQLSDRYVSTPDSPRTIFAARLRELRLAAGLSQEDLAGDAGLHRNYVGTLERAMQSATLDAICKLAAALNVRPMALLDTLPLVKASKRAAPKPSR